MYRSFERLHIPLWVRRTVCTLSLSLAPVSNSKLQFNLEWMLKVFFYLITASKSQKNKQTNKKETSEGFDVVSFRFTSVIWAEQRIFWLHFQFQDGFLWRLLHKKPSHLYALLNLHDKLTFAPCLLTFTGNPGTRQIIPLMAASGHWMHQIRHRGSSHLAVQQSICVSNEFSIFRRGFTLCLRIGL